MLISINTDTLYLEVRKLNSIKTALNRYLPATHGNR